jgi:uncharacterized membrane protein
VPEGDPLFDSWGDSAEIDRRALLGALKLGDERDVDQDASFGIRQLVDVAVRALSPGVNDPTTAVQALHQIHDLLQRLGRRRFPSPLRADDAGITRLILPRPDWDAYVSLALDEVRQYGGSSMQVARRLRSLLEGLRAALPAYRHPPLVEQLALLEHSLAAFGTEPEREIARIASRQGHGPPT